jgi:hypothetical protein
MRERIYLSRVVLHKKIAKNGFMLGCRNKQISVFTVQGSEVLGSGVQKYWPLAADS